MMGNDQTRLQAFTLVETMVALMLTGLVIGFMYSGFRLMQIQTDRLTSALDDVSELYRLVNVLQGDSRRSERIHYNPIGIDCHLPGQTVSYRMVDSFFVRAAGTVSDTLNVRVDSVVGWLASERRVLPDQLIDEGTIHIDIQGRTVPVTIQKRHDTSLLMRYDTIMDLE